jgi:hypothetical protein
MKQYRRIERGAGRRLVYQVRYFHLPYFHRETHGLAASRGKSGKFAA